MPRLRLVFLGACHVELDGKPLTRFGSAKTQGLLAYLALTAGQPHARAVLATLLWPEEPEAAASHNLRQAIYHLRRLLGETEAEPASHRPHLLVNRLQAIGIPCVASTTERVVTEESDGRKVSQFRFVQFRSYAT